MVATVAVAVVVVVAVAVAVVVAVAVAAVAATNAHVAEEAAKLIISFGMVTPDRLPDGAIPQAEPGKAGAGLMPDDTSGTDDTSPDTDTDTRA